MRQYPANSPEALARIVAIAMMADGAIDASELKSLERHDIIGRIGLEPENWQRNIFSVKIFRREHRDKSLSLSG